MGGVRKFVCREGEGVKKVWGKGGKKTKFGGTFVIFLYRRKNKNGS